MAENSLRRYYLFAIKAMTDITATIALPGVATVFFRRLYTGQPHEKLWFYISLAGVFALSMLVVAKKVQRYGEEYKKLTDTESAGSRRSLSG